MRYETYRPEINYEARGYQPLKGRKNHFCQDCVKYYHGLHDEGLTKRRFPFRYKGKEGKNVILCSLDQALVADDLKADDFDTLEQFRLAQQIADPVTWAHTEMAWEPRWYQEEILNCTSQFKAVRAGRRVGKTEALTILVMWYAWTRSNFEILVICPYVAQVDKIFTKIREFMGKSPKIKNSVKRDTRGSPQIIELNNGSIMKGFAAGGGSSKGSDQIRGQDADLIVIDEVDYVNDADIEVIMAILTSNKFTKVVVSSTPTGLRSRLFDWSTDKDDRWKEFWYISAEGPAWDADTEEMYRHMYSPGGFAREFLAQFGEEMTGVFKGTDLQACTMDYDMEACTPRPESCRYTIGVDWNKTTGTHIVVIETPKQGPMTYKMVEKRIIRKSEYTQLRGVDAILELDNKWHPDFIYCDAGYGHTQMELIWKQGELHPERQYHKRIRPIEMGGKTVILDPETGEEIKKDTKPLVVYMAAFQVERKICMFPRSEDTATRIVPEEIPYAEIGVIQQARDFKVTKVSPAGRETFSQDYEHTLTAWMLGIFAHMIEFGNYKVIQHTQWIGQTGPLGMGRQHKVKTHDHFGVPLPPSQVAMQIEMAREQWESDEAHRRRDHVEKKRRNKQHSSFNNGAPEVEVDPEVGGRAEILIASTGGRRAQSTRGRWGRRSISRSMNRRSSSRRGW